MKRRLIFADVRHYCAVMLWITAAVILVSLVPLAIKVIWLGALLIGSLIRAAVCSDLFRGKMDSHRRDDRSGSDQSVFLRGGGEQGSNIDHSTLV